MKAVGPQELEDQPRLTNTSLTDNCDDLAITARCTVESSRQMLELQLAGHECTQFPLGADLDASVL